jgi:hypothetical protein
MQTTAVVTTFIGVDVSKDTLVTCVHHSGTRRTVPNQRSAILAWLKTLPTGSAIGMPARIARP